MGMGKNPFAEVGRYAAGFAAIALITLFYVDTSFKATTAVLTYLLVILVASALWGLRISIFMSLMATLAFDYFYLPPIGKLTINDPQDWVALIAFLVTAGIGSDLSTRARRERDIAERQRAELQQLYDFSSALLIPRNLVELLNEIPQRVLDSFKSRAAAMYLSETQKIYRAGFESSLLDAERLKTALANGSAHEESEEHVYFGLVKLHGKTLGSLGIVGSSVSDQTLEAVGTLIATAIDRATAIGQLGKAEAARERERFKSVLLDAITHDFRTPLTSIKGSVTSMLAGVKLTEPQKHEFLVIIDEECDRINRLVGEAGELARLEAGEVTMMPESCGASDLVSEAVADCASIRASRPLHVEVSDDLHVRADLFWTRKVFVNLLKNADLYSSPGHPISIKADQNGQFVHFYVADEGPGMEATELDEIFGRFYRGKQHRLAHPGTGLGLPIAKAIVEAQGGTINVASEVSKGSVFSFSLPVDGAPNPGG